VTRTTWIAILPIGVMAVVAFACSHMYPAARPNFHWWGGLGEGTLPQWRPPKISTYIIWEAHQLGVGKLRCSPQMGLLALMLVCGRSQTRRHRNWSPSSLSAFPSATSLSNAAPTSSMDS